MRFCKIRILEFVLNKIKTGDSKKEIMCIHFDHPEEK
jgi:hypothetical protein